MCAADSQSEEGLMMLGEKGLNSRYTAGGCKLGHYYHYYGGQYRATLRN